MARIFTGGFESGDLVLDAWTYGETDLGAGGSPTSLPPVVTSAANEHRTLDGTNGGAYGGKLPTFAGQKTMWIQAALAGSPAEIYVRVCLRRTTSGHSSFPFLYLFDQASAFVGSFNLNLDGNDVLSLRGSSNLVHASSNGGHTVPESATVFTRLEFHLKAQGGNILLLETRVNDEVWPEVVDLAGFGPGGSTGISAIRLQGCYNNQAGGNFSTVFYDDIAVNDPTGTINNGFCGNGFIQALTPNGAGTFTQLTNSAGNQTNNYSYVNTLPVANNGTNSVGTGTANTKDTYAITDLPAPALGVNVITIAAYASKNGPGVTNANLVGIFNGTESDGSPIALPVGSPNYLTRQLELNPNTSNPFSRADVQSMQAGILFS